MGSRRDTQPVVQGTTMYGYARVSTEEQGDSRAGLEAQQQAIIEEAARRGWRLAVVATEVASGGCTTRVELDGLLAELGRGDVLVVAKLDRLTRSLAHFAEILEVSRTRGWKLVALDLGVDTTTPTGELVANVMMSVAQWERRIISERTREALAIKKANGVVLGRRPEVDPAVEARVLRLARQGWSYRQIARELTERGYPTARGAERWHHSTVEVIVKRGRRGGVA